MANSNSITTNKSSSIMEAKPFHPFYQIAEAPIHKLLLKQWLKEEELILNRALFCKKSWVLSLDSFFRSFRVIWVIRYKTNVECYLETILEREKEDLSLLAKCVEKLKRKGVERAKSLRVELKPVREWSAQDLVTLFFFTVSYFVLGLTRFILCS
ncbi:hypothetical protein CDL12_27450 [Handroanthus impetiginosus]|uniref:Uncharacterized protein n=1 Tax=Handroanthus impetiginosus TaxID=429701 RepID=A0A2G9G417_9LAMI|nr:hypothetical protein CDL12_27450 [Handroanthus impetiginosus]